MNADKHRALKKLDRSGGTKAERRAAFSAVASSMRTRLAAAGKSTTHAPGRAGVQVTARAAGLVRRTSRVQGDRKSG